MTEGYWLLPSLLSLIAGVVLAGFALLHFPFQRGHLVVVLFSTAAVHGGYAVALHAPQLELDNARTRRDIACVLVTSSPARWPRRDRPTGER